MSNCEPVLGLDIGGANLKAALPDARALSRPFALWRRSGDLASALVALLQELPRTDSLAVTMTGELCDCFASKREGVAHILNSMEQAADGRKVLVWRNDGTLVDLATARGESSLLVAAANWLALATWAGRHMPHGPSLLVDIGSTTTDVIPLRDGVPIPAGRTDPERLACGELKYTGMRRTPVCAILSFDSAAEFFATTLDAYLVLGWTPEDPNDTDTADGRPATQACAHARLARMLCADIESSTERERVRVARKVLINQVHNIRLAIMRRNERLGSQPQTVMVAGSGERLARLAVRHSLGDSGYACLSFAELVGSQASAAACAYALSVLATERMGKTA